jgi:small nuclear ribonucleoprotein (snRNP)-like protein
VTLALTAVSLVLTVALIVGALKWPRPDVVHARVKHRVIVTLKSGQAFTGVLIEADRHAVVLRGVTVVDRAGDIVPVDGEVVCLTAEVDYFQIP